MFIANRNCIQVRVNRTRADASRAASCGGQTSRINEPTCSAAQVAAKAKVDGTYEWTGSEWRVYQRRRAKAFTVQDGC